MVNAQAEPLFGQLWHLENTGQTGGTPGADINILPVWQEYSGAGITIGVVDTGVDYTHPDLAANYNFAADFNTLTGAPDGFTDTALQASWHGTAVSGFIAGDDNGTGSVGVAPDAQVSGIVGLNDASLFASGDFDISNNSWGATVPFSDNALSPQFGPFLDALRTGAEQGRDGLGTVFVFAAGNAIDLFGNGDIFDGDDNANFHGLQNSSFTIAVAALDDNGTRATAESALGFSTPGVPILVSAPGTDVLTTDVTGSGGNDSGDFTTVSGTSFAAPIVSGVVALMLEANPDLGYRDVQEILAYSARQNDVDDARWFENGADNWNGGGLHKNFHYGFGIVDAHAAVRLAETWQQQAVFDNSVVVGDETSFFLGRTIADNQNFVDSFTVEEDIRIDHVQVAVDITHDFLGDLQIFLTSPDGTRSPLLSRPLSGQFAEGTLNFNLTSTDFWGETSEGTWTLEIRDEGFLDSGFIDSWDLRIVGDPKTADDLYVYTDEYAAFAGGDAARQSLNDSQGSDTLNAAAVTVDSVYDLSGGGSRIGATPLEIAAGTAVETVFAGDGDDIITGAGAGERLFGGRGEDSIFGGAGDDLLIGHRGEDFIDGGSGIDTARIDAPFADARFFGTAVSASVITDSSGLDRLSDVERLRFTDGMLALIDPRTADDEVVRLYQAAFRRQPDIDGFDFWSERIDNGTALTAVAAQFIDSAEFEAIYGTGLSDAEFVDQLYINALGRPGDPGGVAFWTGLLEDDRRERAEVLVSFSESPENVANMAGLMTEGLFAPEIV